MMIKNLFKLLKRNRRIRNFYSWLVFLKSIPLKEILKIKSEKMELIFRVKPFTMLSYPRLSVLYDTAIYLEKERRSGSFVECGVWNGGSAAVIAAAAKGNKSRHIWLFDSWEGHPEPTKFDIAYNNSPAWKGMDLGYKENVEEILFQKLKLDPIRIHLVKGWFNETLPLYKKKIGEIALLHLDCDLYESVSFCLRELYDNVIQGGFIFVDDYGYWKGCKKAVDEFLQQKNLNIKLIKIDYTGVYFQKNENSHHYTILASN